MDWRQLAHGLDDPDPAIRIEALSVLAMLEETAAINAVASVYKQDPDERVRRAAGWAGRLLWQAQQRGHTTARALGEQYARASEALEAHFLDSVAREMADSAKPDKPAVRTYAEVEQSRLQRELLDVMYERADNRVDRAPAQDNLPTLAELAAPILDGDGSV